ncbi:MAG TPA: lipopolysaccharide heptosyltransferase II, partial [Bacteroidota bacterium]
MKSPSKTLVIRFSSIGDIVLSTPLLRVLRERFPKSQIDYVTKAEYAELVRSNQNINLTHEFDTAQGFPGLRRLKDRLRQERYDLVVDLHNSLRSRYLRSMRGVSDIVVVDKRVRERTLLVKLKKDTYEGIVPVTNRYIETLHAYRISPDGKGPELHLPDEVLFGTASRIAKLRLSRFERVLGICPFARHATKEWPAKRYAEIAMKFIKETNGAVMIFGGSSDVMRSSSVSMPIRAGTHDERVVDFTGQLSLGETAAAMQYCDVVVTNDTGLMHIAAAMNRRIVAVFGSTVEEFGFFPPKDVSIVLERRGLYCRPCSHIGRNECPEEHFRCM